MLGLSCRTFYRLKRKLKDKGHIAFDFKTKTWSSGENPMGLALVALLALTRLMAQGRHNNTTIHK